jgi:hypothetical protein
MEEGSGDMVDGSAVDRGAGWGSAESVSSLVTFAGIEVLTAEATEEIPATRVKIWG